MFDITLNVNLGAAKSPVVYAWTDVTKEDIVEIEENLLRGLLKLNGVMRAELSGTIPKGSNTNPVEMVVEFLITEDGEKWHRTMLEYPKMGEESQALFLGMLAGGLTETPKNVKDKVKRKKEKPAK